MIVTNNIRYFLLRKILWRTVSDVSLWWCASSWTWQVQLKLAEWCRFTVDERARLAGLPCDNKSSSSAIPAIADFNGVEKLRSRTCFNTCRYCTSLANTAIVDPALNAHAATHNRYITLLQWRELTDLQRFALLKLFKPGHENKNFINAMDEFVLTTRHERAYNY